MTSQSTMTCTLPPSPSSSVNLFLSSSIQPPVYFLYLTQTHPTSEHGTCCFLFGNPSTHLPNHPPQPLILCPAPLAHPVRPTHFPLAILTIWNLAQVLLLTKPHIGIHLQQALAVHLLFWFLCSAYYLQYGTLSYLYIGLSLVSPPYSNVSFKRIPMSVFPVIFWHTE